MLKVGVVGAGVFGGFHARKYAELNGVTFVGVYDPHPERALALAEAHGGRVFATLDQLLQETDAVSITAPADSHAAIGRRALEFGRHLYLEKPLASDAEAAQALVRQARTAGLMLAVGHQERAVFAAMGLLKTSEPPSRLESVRLGTPSPRNRDVSCVLDLMIHDLDLAIALVGDNVVDVQARGGFDEVSAEVVFGIGMTSAFTASRQAPRRERRMRLGYASGDVEVDFLAPSFTNTTDLRLNADFASTPAGRDPLGASLSDFLAAVRGERDRPLVDGVDGLAALRLALRIEATAGAVTP